MIRNISVEFIEPNEIKILIDGKEQKEISSFELKVENGKATYSPQYKIFHKEEKIPKLFDETKMRTIQKAVEEIKKFDPDTRISETSVRKNVKNGNIPCQQEGRTYMVNVLNILEFYKNNAMNEKKEKSGIRKICY